MKKLLILSLILFSSAPLAFAAASEVLTVEKPTYDWNYWSYELGAGVGCFKGPDPLNVSYSNYKVSYAGPLLDLRLGIEKSWHFAKNMTATLDLALLTPAFTVGYLVSPRTRIYIGGHWAVWLNTYATEEFGLSLKAHPFFGLSPRIGFDTFLSPATMLRVNFSYDIQETYKHKTEVRDWIRPRHWLQLTICFKKFF